MKKKTIIILFLFLFAAAGCSGSTKSTIKGVEIIDLKSNGKHLFFYGSKHSNNKSDPMFKEIKKYFYNIDPQMVLVEGYANNTVFENEDKAIQAGENAYVSYIAQKEDIPLDTVEPSKKQQFSSLLNKYDTEKVLAMYVLRQLYQYQNQQKENPKPIKELLEQFVQNFLLNDGFPLEESQTDFEYVRSLLKPYLKVELDEANWMEVDVYSVVYNEGSEINDIYKETYSIRNKYLISTLEEKLQKYDRIFVIMGSQHVIDEREHIEEVLSKLEK